MCGLKKISLRQLAASKGKKQNKGTELLIMNYEIPNFTKFEVSIDNEHENSQLSLDI